MTHMHACMDTHTRGQVEAISAAEEIQVQGHRMEFAQQAADLFEKTARLAKQAAELSKKEAELTTQAAELSEKQAELTGREAHVRGEAEAVTKREAEVTKKEAELTRNEAELSENREVWVRAVAVQEDVEKLEKERDAATKEAIELGAHVQILTEQSADLTRQSQARLVSRVLCICQKRPMHMSKETVNMSKETYMLSIMHLEAFVGFWHLMHYLASNAENSLGHSV